MQEFYVIAAVVLLFPFEIVGAIAILAYVVSYAALGALLLIAFVLMIQVRGGRQLEAAQILYDNEIAGGVFVSSYFTHSPTTLVPPCDDMLLCVVPRPHMPAWCSHSTAWHASNP